jgi:hypothetical protein
MSGDDVGYFEFYEAVQAMAAPTGRAFVLAPGGRAQRDSQANATLPATPERR